jgi:hypothetical protein
VQIPNLAGIATTDLVETIGAGSFKASYINWSRTLQLLREHAPGWLPETVPNAEGSLLHAAPVGCYLLIRFRNGEQVTPAVPQAVMDTRNAAIQHDKITARDLTDTHRRGVCLAAAMTFGLAYELWAKLPLESGYEEEKKEERQERRVTPKPPAAPPTAPKPVKVVIDTDAAIRQVERMSTLDLLDRIELASTMEGLELLRADMRRMPKGNDRDRVIAAAKRRADQIRAEQEPPAGDPQIVQAEEGTV